jgi:hypothetical protein
MRGTALISVTILVFSITPSAAQTFRGYECTVDCSGHEAGYDWAEAKGITDEDQCEDILITAPNSTSFYEGCMAYVEGSSRGADDDDDDDDDRE